ncbi:MAG: sugar-binding domain-containing protein [Limisphaerales bacterium]
MKKFSRTALTNAFNLGIARTGWIAGLITLVALGGSLARAQTLSLAGRWHFQLDRADAGINEQWFTNQMTGTIRLPGSLPEQGIGDDISTNTQWTGEIVDRSWFTAPEYARYRQPGNIKVPFWLQPDKYYTGAAWFQRDIEVPKKWAGKRIVLSLERPHWETRVWLDGKPIGTNISLSTPHEHDLGEFAPGKHTLTIRVDNRMIVDIGENSHAVSDHTQGNWNGIVGKIELRATPSVWIEDLQVYPHVATKSVTVKGKVGNASGQPDHGQVQLASNGQKSQLAVAWETNGGSFETEFQLGGSAKTWDEFSPNVYTLSAKLDDGAEADVTFGLREISTDGTQFTVNGRKTFFRGTLECCIFPKTGHPPTDVAEWKRIMGVAKSYGLNLVRFHSYCPPEAAFEAADELGMYLQVETCWANNSTELGAGRPVDQWVYDETARILKAYGNHPSFVLMPYGNEPGGRNANAYLAGYVSHFKALDPRRLWTTGSGWPQLPENQFHITADPRIQRWGEGLKSRINSKPPETITDYHGYISGRKAPVISHEIGQWCVYPNFAEIPKYTGYLKPENFEIFHDRLATNGLGRLAKQFLLASGKLQMLCYKEDIESALRTHGMGGFELLDLHDFPGQGTALVGVLDPFWGEKGYVTAAEYSRFCNATVPLARLAKRVFTSDEKLNAQIEVAHFGAAPLKAAATSWKLVADDGSTFASGKFDTQDLPVDNGIVLGKVSVDLKNAKTPARFKLTVTIQNATSDAKLAENDWDVWIYPTQAAVEPPKAVLVTSQFGEQAKKQLQSGGKVLLTLPPESIRNFDPAPVQLGFSGIFWNTAWTKRQPPTTLGILCNPKHPALAEFPTDFYSNWQWWYLIHRAGALRLDGLPKDLDPIVRVIDDWVTARPLGLVIEAKVGKGKIIVSGFDLTGDLNDPVSRQMRQSLLDYMGGDSFDPKIGINIKQIRNLAPDSLTAY